MIPYIFLFAFFNMEVMGQRDPAYINIFSYDNRKAFEHGYVCNYEVHYLPNLNFLLYTCVHNSQCNSSHAGFYTWEKRNPQLHISHNMCDDAFYKPAEGTYVCCHPHDNMEVPHSDKNKTHSKHVANTLKYVPGFRSAFKCNDYKILACLSTAFCPSSKRRQNENFVPLDKRGLETDIGKYPYLVLVGWYDEVIRGLNNEVERVEQSWYCLGSIISQYHVLTAASCWKVKLNESFIPRISHVRAGDTELCLLHVDCKPSKTRQVIGVKETNTHPKYHKDFYYHDIMVAKLFDAFKWNSKVRPACLFNKPDVFVTFGGMFSFYESATKDGVTRNSVHEFEIETWSVIGCFHKYHSHDRLIDPRFLDQDILFCAGLPAAGKTPCVGDYGGALVVDNDQTFCTWNIYGVMAYAPNLTCGGHKPPVFVRVPYYLNWIEEFVWKDMDMFREFDTCSGSCKDTLSAKRNTLGRCKKYAE